MSRESLYQEVILSHNRHPQNTGVLENPDIDIFDSNPVCGDQVRLTLRLAEDKTIADIKFDAKGCALSIASSSMLTTLLKNLPLSEAKTIAIDIVDIFKGRQEISLLEGYGDLTALQGVLDFPTRIKCVLMSWELFLKID